jgi:hypothetical protein
LANYQNTLGQLAGYQEKQWQLNKQQPWMDAMEAANRLAEAGSQNIMTGLKDLSGIGVAMARQGEIGGEPSKGMSGVLGSAVSGITPRSRQAATPAPTPAVVGTTTPPAVSTEQNVATTPPAVNTAQNVVTTQPTTTATEAVTPVATTLPVQETMNFNAAPSMMAGPPTMQSFMENVPMPQSPAQQFLTPVAPTGVQQSILPVGPPTLQSFMGNTPMPAQENILPTVEMTDTAPASTPLRGNMASPFNMQPNYNVQDQYGFMLPTQQPTSLTENQIQQIVNPINIGMTQDRFVAPTSFGISGVGTNSGTKQMSAYPTMTQFQSASPREKLDLFAQGFGQFGLKGK